MGPRKTAVPGNQDLLMQTFMNVVGVLVVLLALMQLRVRDAVSQTTQNGVASTGNPVADTQNQLNQIEADVARLKKEVEATEAGVLDSRRKLETNRTEILVLKPNVALPVPSDDDDDVKAMRAQVSELRKRAGELGASAEKAQVDTDKLQTTLDETPVPKMPLPIEVAPPNPRSAPRNAELVEFICREKRVAPYNEAALRRMAQERIERAYKQLHRDNGIDCEALKQIFDKEEIGTKYLKMTIERDAHRPRLVVDFKKSKSDQTEEDLVSMFQAYALDSRKKWIRFRVYPDSFGEYLTARNLLRSRYKGIQVGWVPVEQGQVDINFTAELPCSAPDPAQPLVPVAQPEPEKVNDKKFDSKGKQSTNKLQKAIKDKKKQEAAMKAAGAKAMEQAKKGEQLNSAAPTAPAKDNTASTPPAVEQKSLKIELPGTTGTPAVPNDDID